MNITIDKVVLEQALSALEQINSPYWSDFVAPHIAQLREALAQPQPVQELVAWYDGKNFYENPESASMCMAEMTNLHPLYTHPAPKQEPLSDEQIDAITISQWGDMRGFPLAAHRAYARAVEAAHGIKGETK